MRRPPNVWELRIFVGRDPSGKVRHRYFTFVGPKRDAERELARQLLLLDEIPEPVSEGPSRSKWGKRTTFNDAIAAWKANGWDDLSPKTQLSYQQLWDSHIYNRIGERPIATTGIYEVEQYFRELSDHGLGESGIRQVRAILYRACKLAGKWSNGMIPNPVSGAERPKGHRREPVRAPSIEEVRAILATLAKGDDLRLYVFVRLAIATGMRRGEIAALRLNDINFVTGELRVDEGVVIGAGGISVKAPKTKVSVRKLSVDAETLALLAQLRDEQLDLATRSECVLGEDAFLFSFVPGGETPPYPDVFSKNFASFRARHEIAPDIHLHSFRHFAATVLDSVVSERQKQARMGWSTTHMARHYTDAVGEEDQRAAERIGEILR
ncbi:site-specific integrase [Ferrimicrobium sp.]|uniref:tyrosine-type recombinase/integrase n=1 Tax=Ferrimicrobium sp. TaxID=2926050 RepID=UPI00263A2DCC|nr:site-specific integrase [Ferrimicrobium sp.]